MKTFQTPNAPIPAGHYSQAVSHGGLLFISGQLPIHPADPTWKSSDIREQTRRVLLNLEAILEEAGCTRSSVLKVTVYVSDIELWGTVNEEYAGFFGDHRPARAIVPVRDLHHGFKIELEAVAASR